MTGNPPTANRCQRGTEASSSHQKCMATSCIGKSGQQISGSELEGRKREKNAKYSIEFLFLGYTPCSYLWWKLQLWGLEQYTAVQTRNAGLHFFLTSDMIFHHLQWQRHRKCWYTALRTWKFTYKKTSPQSRGKTQKVLLKNSTRSKSCISFLPPEPACFLTCTHSVFAA